MNARWVKRLEELRFNVNQEKEDVLFAVNDDVYCVGCISLTITKSRRVNSEDFYDVDLKVTNQNILNLYETTEQTVDCIIQGL